MTLDELLADADTIATMDDQTFARYWDHLGQAVRLASGTTRAAASHASPQPSEPELTDHLTCRPTDGSPAVTLHFREPITTEQADWVKTVIRPEVASPWPVKANP